ncbi:MAG: hypothetical protein WA705_06595 [Candidatus Ozemobacteraceae bacterium]
MVFKCSIRFLALLIPVLLLSAFSEEAAAAVPGTVAAKKKTAVPAEATNLKQRPISGELVLMIFQRVFSIGEALVKAQEILIFRLRKNKTIRAERFKSRMLSGKDQMRSLYLRGCKFEKLLDSANPRLPEIQFTKQKTSGLKTAYEANSAQISAIIRGRASSISSLSEIGCDSVDSFDPPAVISTTSFHIDKLDDGF